MIPKTDTKDSMTVHDLNVSFRLILKYSLNIQKLGSFTCEHIKLPAPTDRTKRLGSKSVVCNKGSKTLTVINPAAVAEPTQTRIIAAIIQANKYG